MAQKERTRWHLLQAARDLRSAGHVPSVADVADATGISRTTAYRYFPTQEALLAEATADPLRVVAPGAGAAVIGTGTTSLLKRAGRKPLLDRFPPYPDAAGVADLGR